MDWLERHRATAIALLLALMLIGGGILLYRQAALPRATEIIISTPSPQIRIYVEGEVVNPGIYSLKVGGLIGDAIDAAGGFTPDADHESVNLAAVLRDDTYIRIYRSSEAPQRININTAGAWLLEALPGIGEELAQRIIAYRTENGPFQSVEDLIKVKGISAALLEKIRDKITVH